MKVAGYRNSEKSIRERWTKAFFLYLCLFFIGASATVYAENTIPLLFDDGFTLEEKDHVEDYALEHMRGKALVNLPVSMQQDRTLSVILWDETSSDRTRRNFSISTGDMVLGTQTNSLQIREF